MVNRKILIFDVYNKRYGIDINEVERVVGAEKIVTIPTDSSLIDGIIEYQDDILPVLNLAKVFGEKKESNLSDYKIIIIFDGVRKIGIKVSSVSIVESIDENNIESIPKIALGIKNEQFKGIIKYNNELVLLVDGNKLLDYK